MSHANAFPARRAVPAALAVLALLAAPAAALEYVDVDQSDGIGGTSTGIIWQQTFIPSADNLTAVSIDVYIGTHTITISILDAVCGTVLGSGTATGTGWVKCDMTTPIALTPGNTYVIDLDGVGAVPFTLNVGDDPYADGAFYQNCGIFNNGDADLVFRTWAEADPVSEEAASWSAVKNLYR